MFRKEHGCVTSRPFSVEIMTDRLSDQPTDQQTDMIGYWRDITFQITLQITITRLSQKENNRLSFWEKYLWFC